jgi:dihydroorotase-like cyclic amidohydrolase
MLRIVAVLLAAGLLQQVRPFDLLVANGLIVDGSGRKPFRGSVAARDGRIVAIGPDVAGSATTTIDATGHAIAPGSSTFTRMPTTSPRSRSPRTSPGWA